MFYELHISDIAPGKRQAARSLFTDSAVHYFNKHGIKPMLFCEAEFGGPTDQIVYLIPWDSLTEYEGAWEAFRADPDWLAANERAQQDGRIFLRTTKTLFRDIPELTARIAQPAP
jgi:hypothetical protein